MCASDAACEADAYCADDGECTAGCRLDPDTCALGARCDAVTRTCAPLGCAGDDACPADFFCADDATCRAGCRDAGCAALQVCDLSTRSCVDGGRCRRDADCDADAYAYRYPLGFNHLAFAIVVCDVQILEKIENDFDCVV